MILTGACQDRSMRFQVRNLATSQGQITLNDHDKHFHSRLRYLFYRQAHISISKWRSSPEERRCWAPSWPALCPETSLAPDEPHPSPPWTFLRTFSSNGGQIRKKSDETNTAQINLCECICRSLNLMQLLLRCKAEAVHGVCPAVCPLSKLLGRLGKCHAGCHGAVDDCLNMQREQRRRRMRPQNQHKMTQIIWGGCFCNVFIIISVKNAFLLHSSYLVFHFRD